MTVFDLTLIKVLFALSAVQFFTFLIAALMGAGEDADRVYDIIYRLGYGFISLGSFVMTMIISHALGWL